jgi:hypothetical protein
MCGPDNRWMVPMQTCVQETGVLLLLLLLLLLLQPVMLRAVAVSAQCLLQSIWPVCTTFALIAMP